MSTIDADHARTAALAKEVMDAIQANYMQGPTSRDRIYEALNALAVAAAFVLARCDDPEADAWFSAALNNQLREIACARGDLFA